MQLSRRQFFAASAAATFVAALPHGVLALPSNPAIGVDAIRKTLQIREPIHFRALYRLICDQCDREFGGGDELDITATMPLWRITDEIFEFQDDWGFADDESRKNIRAASWREGDDIYSQVLSVGWQAPDENIKWRSSHEEGVIRPGEPIKAPKGPVTFVTPSIYAHPEYRVLEIGIGTTAVPISSPDPEAVRAVDLCNIGWTDVSEIPQGLLVRA